MNKRTYCNWDNILNKEQIRQVNLICKKYHDQIYRDHAAGNVIKTVDVGGIKWKFLRSELRHVVDIWRQSNKFIFGYDLFQLSNIDMWNINTYDSKNKGEYDFHYDLTDNYVSDIKLTGIVNVSDEQYEGGELIIFDGHEFREVSEIKNPGSSILLRHGVLHKVNPVTKGIRKTISYWFYGLRFI